MSVREVGAGKPFATISGAIADLEVVEGSTPFTETQTIRVYNGSYTETPISQNVLKPTATYRLIIEAAAGNSPVLDGQNITTYGFYFYETDYLTIKGFEIKNFPSAFSTYMYNCDYVIFENLLVHDCASGYGIYFIYTSKYGIIRNCEIYTCYAPLSLGENCVAYDNIIRNSNNGIGCRNNCTVYNNIVHDMTNAIVVNVAANCKIYDNTVYNVSYGISSYGYGGADNAEIYGNDVYNATGANILLGGNNMKIYNNYVYDNPSYIGIDITGNNNLIYNNLIRNIAYVSLGISYGSGNRVYNNTIYGAGWLVSLTNLTGLNYLKNNILWEMGGSGCIFTVPADLSNIVSENNCLYKTAGYIAYIWNTIPCPTLAVWQANSGQDLTSISLDPLFVNVAGTTSNDFKITSTSPCRGIGVDLSLYFNTDFISLPRAVPWDMGAFIFPTPATILTASLSSYNVDYDGTFNVNITTTGYPAYVTLLIGTKSFVISGSNNIYSGTIEADDIGLGTFQVAYQAINVYGGVYLIDASALIIFSTIAKGSGDIKQEIYESLINDAILTALLGGTVLDRKIYHYKKPSKTPAGTKCVCYAEIVSGARAYEDHIDDAAYEIYSEAANADDTDILFERILRIMQDKSFQKGKTGCHRLRLDWKSPDILLGDQITWQKIARFVAVIERV